MIPDLDADALGEMKALDGLFVRTSQLTKSEFSDLIELIYAFGAQRGVVFTDPRPTVTPLTASGR